MLLLDKVVLCQLVVLFKLSVCLGANIPPFIKPCYTTTDQCFTKATQDAVVDFVAGIPELGIELLDPLKYGDVDVVLAGVKVAFTEGAMKGYRSIIVDNMHIDPATGSMKWNYHANATMKGKYKADGVVLLLPVYGEGDYRFKMKEVHVEISASGMGIEKRGGRGYLKLRNLQKKFQVIGGLQITLTNLFGGNKQLSDTFHKVINDNWQLMVNDFSGPLFEKVYRKTVLNMKKLFNAIPIDDLIPSWKV